MSSISRPIRFHRPEYIGVTNILSSNKASYLKGNPIFDYETDRAKNVHRLDDMFNNRKVLERFFFIDVWFIMRGMGLGENDLGPSFAKNAMNRTHLYFDKDKSQLTIHGTKTYSRRSESKKRIYPAEWLVKRISWFLGQSLYVESFKVRQKDMNFFIDIKFKDCYTEERKKMIMRLYNQRLINKAEFELNQIEWAIENHDTIENLIKRSDDVRIRIKNLKLTKEQI